jgi:hypothetical protein
MEDEDAKDVLTIEEIAKRLRCSKTHVCNLFRGKSKECRRSPM